MPDHDRPLNHRGLKDAPRMGIQLAKSGFKADLIISSTALRAKHTAQLIAEKIGYEAEAIKYNRSIYDESVGNIISILQEIPDSVNTVMIFGHNPTQEGVLRFLTDMGSSVTMPTGAIACLESHTSDWKSMAPNWITLKWLLIPKIL